MKYVSKRCTGISPFTLLFLNLKTSLATSPMVSLPSDLLGYFYACAQSRREMDGKLGSHSDFQSK